MTYKELVDKIAQIVSDHYILRDFGYGALTDIKTVDSGERVNYPYVFLNPTQSTRTGQEITYRFNLIAMDVAEEEQGYSNYLEVQSNCQQYIDDILAHLRFQTPLNRFDLTLNVSLTPFKERFQDTVAGMTATLEIVLPLPLNDCITPYDPPQTEWVYLIQKCGSGIQILLDSDSELPIGSVHTLDGGVEGCWEILVETIGPGAVRVSTGQYADCIECENANP